MGHTQVFSHVGDHVRIQAPNGKHVAPLVTGTFGSSDFTHSLLGGAGCSVCLFCGGLLLTLSFFLHVVEAGDHLVYVSSIFLLSLFTKLVYVPYHPL